MFVDAPKEIEIPHSERTFAVVKELLALVSDIDEIHAGLNGTITVCDQKTQDVLHEIEFGNFNASEWVGVGKQMRAIRQERREAKNQKELISYFKKFSDDHKNLPMVLAKLLQSMKQTRQAQETRQYTPRVPE